MLRVTVSIGLSSASEEDANLEDVIARADQALYRANMKDAIVLPWPEVPHLFTPRIERFR